VEVLESDSTIPLDAFLDRPLFCFLARQSDAGASVSPLWFLWADDAVWTVGLLAECSYPDRVRTYPRWAVAVVDFDPVTGRVEHVGMRGTASLEDRDPEPLSLLETYCGSDEDVWDPLFEPDVSEGQALIRFEPETAVAREQSSDGRLPPDRLPDVHRGERNESP
jgi:hypothetical protein